MSNVAPQRPEEDGLPQQHPTFIDFSSPPPDLTDNITKIKDYCVAVGAFGDVYRCRYLHGSISQEVAVKVLRFKLPVDGDITKDKSVQMVRRELGIWKRLSHDNIVPFLGVANGFGMSGTISLVSLWMPNGTLHKFLVAHDNKLDVAHRLQILLDIAKGLDYLHSFPIVHGDLNTNNVLLDADYNARLADFGHASGVGVIPEALGYLRRSTDRPGDLRWIAPEQISLEGPIIRSTKNDIYSFGSIAFEVLSGKQPWSEVVEDAAVVLRLYLGHKPARPESRVIDDSHWNIIQRCWSASLERPSADSIIVSIQGFLSNSEPLRDLFILPSSQAQGPLDGVVSSADYHIPIDENDTIIAVMGPTGAGKSSFVNIASGRTEVVTGYDLKSIRAVQPVRCSHPDGRRDIVLVDTPGFDGAYPSDAQILRIIANWLRETYESNIKLAGILYLHRISDVRNVGAPLGNLAVFKDLCGDGSLKNIVLVTTMWDEVEDQSVGSKREEELRSTYWKDVIRLGSGTCRFQGTRESAWEIIDRLNLEGSRQTLEVVDRLPLHESAAARTLLRFLAAEFKKDWLRKTVGTKRPTAGQSRQHALSRSPTIGSGTSETAWSVASTITSSNSSHSSSHPFNPVESTSSGCSASGHREALLAVTTGLRLAHQMADIASIPMLRRAIGTVLHIAQLIRGMGGAHHAISQVIEYSGWLLEEIAQYAAGSELSKDMKRTLQYFQKELKQLQNSVKKISNRGRSARLFLYDGDIHAIMACDAAIKVVYDKLDIRLAIDNRQAIARFHDQLKTLFNDGALRQCECGLVI